VTGRSNPEHPGQAVTAYEGGGNVRVFAREKAA